MTTAGLRNPDESHRSPLTYVIGSVRVHLISDGLYWADAGGLFGVVPRVLWEKVMPPDDRHRVPMEQWCALIETGEGLILVDTGYGDKLTEKQRQLLEIQGEGRLERSLARLGFRPDDVRLVINTHLHADHCGGNTRFDPAGQIVPTFRNATYLMQRLELADATYPNERTRATYFRENFLPLLNLCEFQHQAVDISHRPAARILNGDTQITSEVRVMVTPGHTRSHQVVVIESQGETGVFLGDAASLPINLERLAWVPAFDLEPQTSIETKRSLRDWAWRKNALLLFQHEVAHPAGRIRPEGDAWRVEPVSR